MAVIYLYYNSLGFPVLSIAAHYFFNLTYLVLNQCNFSLLETRVSGQPLIKKYLRGEYDKRAGSSHLYVSKYVFTTVVTWFHHHYIKKIM